MNATDYIIPALILAVLMVAFFRRIAVYDVFAKGASRAMEIAWGVFPYIATIMIMIQLLRASGITGWVAGAMSPAFDFVGIPPELAELVLIRPFTSSGSTALLNDIFVTHGADSYVSRCAAAIMSCSETVFYVTAVYISSTKIKRLKYCVPVAILAQIVSAVVACLLCRVM